ncbi:hypothetical protein [Mucilaginibacter sp.]|uniref:hypothetical protein n=1 Tax=Mucilaginibacter sp. TaxID=1882438 RepID=UPI0032657CC8
MDYKIKLADGKAHLVSITSAYFKSWQVWQVKFKDGKVAMLYKMGSEWMQRNEDFLEAEVLEIIGYTIDRIIYKRTISF